MPSSRQLAAIMFADIAGFTALMENDEAMAMRFRNKMQKKLEEEVPRHFGRLLEIKGDGALCSFTSAIEAVRAALALQLDMQRDLTVPLRIGIHTGDVLIEGDSIFGDGVNIASRVESFAVPGSIFITGRVYEDIKNQKDIQTLSLGKYAFKNVSEQMEIYAISNPGIRVPSARSLEGKGEKARMKSILVLPFVNMSNETEQEYFSDGLTEELISSLSRLKDIRVISRTTSMKYKNTTQDIKTIGAETSAGYIMEGSVRRQGNDLRITAQFVDAIRDEHLWADNYRGTADDIFDIQEKVAEKIVGALRVKLTGEEKNNLQKRYTESNEAYHLYLKGRFFWNKRSLEGLQTSIRFFEEAIEKDQDYALAWAGIADAYSLMGEYTNLSRRELHPKQMEAVNKALEIDGQLGEAHISLGITLMLNEWDWKNAEKELKLGIELSPNYATGHHWYAELLLFLGRTPEAFREIDHAVFLDPLSPAILKDKGIFYYYNRQYDKAIELAQQTLELDPGFITGYRLLTLAYQGKGMFPEAISENQRWGALTGNEKKTEMSLASIYASAGRGDEAKKLIEDAAATNQLGRNDFRAAAMVYSAIGETEIAFDWLEKSYARHEESLSSLKVDPKFDAIRADPRFNIILRKIGLLE